MRTMILLWYNEVTEKYCVGSEDDFHQELREYSSKVLLIKYKMDAAQWTVLKKIEEKLNATKLDSETPML